MRQFFTDIKSRGFLAIFCLDSRGASDSRVLSMFYLVLPLFLLLLIRPPGVLVVMEEGQDVDTINPKVGVHTRLTDEVEAWKIQRSLRMVREMGAPWIVEYFPWAYIEGQQGRYAWGHSDIVVKHACNQGLTIIARLGMVPDWARPDPAERETTFTYIDPEHYEDFARFVMNFVARYRQQIQHIIVWNEPNLSFEWGYRPVDPEAYVDLLRAVYPAAHAAYPDVVVLGGALAPTLEIEGSAAGLSDLLYLERMYLAGAAPYFDALAAHTYGLTSPPEAPPDLGVLNFRRVELLRDIMEKYHDAEKPIYITEAGWNEHPRWVWAVEPSQRVTYTIRGYEWAKMNWPWCPVVAMWMFRTPRPLHNYQDYYTFVTPDFRQRPIYNFLRMYTQGELTSYGYR